MKIQTGNDAVNLLPEMDITTDFNWRIRVDVRSAINIPFNRTSESRLPSCYIGISLITKECGWTMYAHQDINMAETARSVTIESNRFPIWNHQLLYYPPPNVNIIDGFFNILLKDRYSVKPVQKIFFPLNVLKPYHPAHLVN